MLLLKRDTSEIVLSQAASDLTSLYIGIITTSDCLMAEVILSAVSEIDQARSNTISTSSPKVGKACVISNAMS